MKQPANYMLFVIITVKPVTRGHHKSVSICSKSRLLCTMINNELMRTALGRSFHEIVKTSQWQQRPGKNLRYVGYV